MLRLHRGMAVIVSVGNALAKQRALPQGLSFVFLAGHNIRASSMSKSYHGPVGIAVSTESYSGYRILYPSYNLRICYEVSNVRNRFVQRRAIIFN